MEKIKFCLLNTAFCLIILLANIFSAEAEQLQYLDERTLADILANTQTAQKTNQIILVVDHNFSLWNKTTEGWWRRDMETYCGYGRNGFSANRHAGDKTTPVGAFPVLYAFGNAPNPGTALAYKNITPYSYLSAEKSTYNTWIESAYKISGEHLIDYYQYKYAMNIGFNINPVIYGKGSAIFLHCKSYNRWWTSGCISLAEKDMIELLQRSYEGEYIIIVEHIADIANY